MAESSPWQTVVRHTGRRRIVLSSDFSDKPEDDYLPLSDPFSDSETDEITQLFPINDGGSSPLSDFETPQKPPTIAQSSPLSSAPHTPSPPLIAASSSPMYTPRTERKHLKDQTQQRRQGTLAQNQGLWASEKQAQEEAQKSGTAEEEAQKKAYFDGMLGGLQARDYSLSDFLEYVFNPATIFSTGFDWRWRGFFSHKPTVEKIFSYWTASQVNKSTRTFISDWAMRLVTKEVGKESRRITKSGILNKSKKTVNEEFFLSYSLTELSKKLRGMGPTVFGVLDAFSSTARQLKVKSKRFFKKHDVVSSVSNLLSI